MSTCPTKPVEAIAECGDEGRVFFQRPLDHAARCARAMSGHVAIALSSPIISRRRMSRSFRDCRPFPGALLGIR
jgi:hypothetical protein